MLIFFKTCNNKRQRKNVHSRINKTGGIFFFFFFSQWKRWRSGSGTLHISSWCQYPGPSKARHTHTTSRPRSHTHGAASACFSVRGLPPTHGHWPTAGAHRASSDWNKQRKIMKTVYLPNTWNNNRDEDGRCCLFRVRVGCLNQNWVKKMRKYSKISRLINWFVCFGWNYHPDGGEQLHTWQDENETVASLYMLLSDVSFWMIFQVQCSFIPTWFSFYRCYVYVYSLSGDLGDLRGDQIKYIIMLLFSLLLLLSALNTFTQSNFKPHKPVIYLPPALPVDALN